jgi:hypothetical protein
MQTQDALSGMRRGLAARRGLWAVEKGAGGHSALLEAGDAGEGRQRLRSRHRGAGREHIQERKAPAWGRMV